MPLKTFHSLKSVSLFMHQKKCNESKGKIFTVRELYVRGIYAMY